MKKIFRDLNVRVFMIVSTILLVTILVVNILSSTVFYDTVCTVFGRSSIRLTGEDSSVFRKDVADKAAALENGNAVSMRICEEGFTLLKNADVGGKPALPLGERETRVSVFGKNSVNMAKGGSGSGGSVNADAKDIFDSLTASGFEYNPSLVEFYRDDARSGKGRDSNPTDLDNGEAVSLSEGETPVSAYGNLFDTCSAYSDLAIVVITRIGGEGFDLPRSADGSHFLQLSSNERDLLERVGSMDFGKVLLVINAANTLELASVKTDSNIDAVLWVGYAGGNGMMALGELLRGKTLEGEEIGPSGRTVDTYRADFTHDPTWENFGSALGGDAYFTTTVDKRTGKIRYDKQQAYFVDYEEGNYIGYRYYETAYAEALEGNYEGFVYEDEVVWPFGYGLSFTTFSWTLENEGELKDIVLKKNDALTFRVRVENTGTWSGRDVVQLYVTPPYHRNGIEKSAKVLVGFAKTKSLAPGESEVVSITVDSPYVFASYDYKDADSDGFRGYEAEAGDYIFSLSTDAHTPVIAVPASIPETIRYTADPVTGETVSNRFTDREDSGMDSDRELATVLSRADFSGTWPQRRSEEEKDRNDSVDWLDSIMHAKEAPNRPAAEVSMPATGKENGIVLAELAGADYSDPLWERFLDQLTVAEMTDLVNRGGFHTEAIERLGVPQTTAADGPVGFCNFLDDPTIYGTCVYPCEVVLASTWNTDRLYDMGVSLGNEGLVGNEKGDGAPYTGWYAPGVNLHRSPFGGRNFEYYSEDPFLSGYLAAAAMKGAAEKGVYVDLKHFALNEQETHRSSNGVLTWATEQSVRELYLKSFEIAVKQAKGEGVKAMGVMTSFNRIGERWTGGDWRLLTGILRNEWGFEGLVICDFNTCNHMVEKDMFYAGGDLNLQILNTMVWRPDGKDATDVSLLRESAKNILFVVANSNAMRGEFTMTIPTWQIIAIVISVAIVLGLSVWGVFAIRSALGKEAPANGKEAPKRKKKDPK